MVTAPSTAMMNPRFPPACRGTQSRRIYAQYKMVRLRLPSCQDFERVVQWPLIRRAGSLSAGVRRKPTDAAIDGPGDHINLTGTTTAASATGNNVTGAVTNRPTPVDLIARSDFMSPSEGKSWIIPTVVRLWPWP